MAWRDSLLDCSFRGVVFDIVGTRDGMGRALSVAEFPYQAGAYVEDLGARPVRFSLHAIFFGTDYELRLADLLAALDEPGAGELIHPVWGSIPLAQFVSCEISHDAPEPDACTVAIEFIESSPERPFFEQAGAGQAAETVGAYGDTALDGVIDSLGEIVDTLKALNPFAALEGLRQDLLGPLLDFTAQAQGIVTSGLDVLDYPRAWARDVATLANGVLSIASFDDRLLQDWQAVTSVFFRVSGKFGYGSHRGRVTVTPWRSGVAPTEAQARAVASASLSVINAGAVADATATLLAAEAQAATLSPPEIEAAVNAARTEIDAAIEATRAALDLERSRAVVEPLKAMALALQEAARAIIEARPPLIRRRLDAPGNLRLIAHRWYGDHARAAELARLNPIRHPNALAAGDTLNAYAQ